MKAFVKKARAPYLIVLSTHAGNGKCALYYRNEVVSYNPGDEYAEIADDADHVEAVRRWESLPSQNQ